MTECKSDSAADELSYAGVYFNTARAGIANVLLEAIFIHVLPARCRRETLRTGD